MIFIGPLDSKHVLIVISVLNCKIVVLGGVDSTGSLSSTMHEYDPEKNRWKVFGQLPRPMKSKLKLHNRR